MRKYISLFLAVTVAVVFSGCGTLFWAERKSKTPSDKIDPAVLILDCCGLLFGLIPGVVALVLDFNNKTIYYSKGELSSVTELNESEMIAVKVESMDREAIEAALSRELGRPVSLDEIQLSAI